MSVGRSSLAIPILAVVLFAASLGWFGYRQMRPELAAGPATSQDAPAPLARPSPTAPTAAAPDTGAPSPSPGPSAPQPASPGRSASVDPSSVPAGGGAPSSSPADAARKPAAEQPAGVAPGPVFDVVRVEPSGEAVIAGRAGPGATVELVVNGKVYATAVADPSGLFALVPPALAPGPHEIVLQIRGQDGTRTQSAQSVTVVVAANRTDAPLVTVAAPGQPSVILSRPDDPTRVAGVEPASPPGVRPSSVPGTPAVPASDAPRPAAPRPAVRIASVEAEGAGRLLVAGNAAPAATVRLYLNDTFVAPGSAGKDGRITFSIERGVQPGSYQVRLDDVDPVSAGVRSRAEVSFLMPQPVFAAATPPGRAAPQASGPTSSGTTSSGPTSPGATSSGPTSAGSGPTRPATGGPERRDVAAAPSAPPPSGAPDLGTTVVVPEVNTAIVTRGESLWVISKRTYGEGLRYTVIFGANNRQIRDPNLIYPGQVFVLPTPREKGASR